MKKAKHNSEGWQDTQCTPTKIELVKWTDTEVCSLRRDAEKHPCGLGTVFSIGLLVKETKSTVSLAQSLYIASEAGFGHQIGDVITIPKSIIVERKLIASAKTKKSRSG